MRCKACKSEIHYEPVVDQGEIFCSLECLEITREDEAAEARFWRSPAGRAIERDESAMLDQY
jgi:hypothetical protein